jgi:C4-dicarboxylate-specific signal transduction histidine kinase
LISLLALALTLQPADLTFVEPLKLTSGVEVNATYSAPIDSLCLTLEDFVLVKLDMAEAVTAIEGERAHCQRRVEEARADSQVTIDRLTAEVQDLHERREELTRALEEARFDMRLWRASAVGVLMLGGVALIVIATR